MGSKALKLSFAAIITYLVVEHYVGAGTILSKGSAGVVNVVKGFQGR